MSYSEVDSFSSRRAELNEHHSGIQASTTALALRSATAACTSAFEASVDEGSVSTQAFRTQGESTPHVIVTFAASGWSRPFHTASLNPSSGIGALLSSRRWI